MIKLYCYICGYLYLRVVFWSHFARTYCEFYVLKENAGIYFCEYQDPKKLSLIK